MSSRDALTTKVTKAGFDELVRLARPIGSGGQAGNWALVALLLGGAGLGAIFWYFKGRETVELLELAIALCLMAGVVLVAFWKFMVFDEKRRERAKQQLAAIVEAQRQSEAVAKTEADES